MKRTLYTFLLSLLPFHTFASQFECLADWAESAAPSLFASSTNSSTIEYGSYLLRYYEMSAKVLAENGNNKNIYFYDVSGYLKGDEAIQLYAEPRTSDLTFEIRRWIDKQVETSFAIVTVNGIETKIELPATDPGRTLPYWSSYIAHTVPVTFEAPPGLVSIVSEGGLAEIKEIFFDGISLEPGSINYIDIAGTVNPYWLDHKIRNFNIKGSSLLQSLGNREYWNIFSGCKISNEPKAVQQTSYENTHSSDNFSFEPPVVLQPNFPSNSQALADWLQIGTMSLLVSELAPYTYDSESELRSGKLKFYSRENKNSEWVDVTDILLDDETGCILARKILVGDFNNDGKPDAFFLCTGTDLINVTGERDFGEPANRIILSTDSGKYENREVSTSYPFTYSHGGFAFDYNDDGNLDVLATDTISGEWVDGAFKQDGFRFGSPYLLLGDGAGNFEFSSEITDLFTTPKYRTYYSIEGLDVDKDGDVDIWANGKDENGYVSFILINEDNKYSIDRKIELPIDKEYVSAQDVMLIDSNLYTTYIKLDYSKSPYYWGIAVQKVDLDTLQEEIIYSHDGIYDNQCGKHHAGGKMSWFIWLHYEDGYLMPRNSCSGIKIAIDP